MEPGGLRARHQDSDSEHNLSSVKNTSFPSLVQEVILHCKYPLLTTTFMIILPLVQKSQPYVRPWIRHTLCSHSGRQRQERSRQTIGGDTRQKIWWLSTVSMQTASRYQKIWLLELLHCQCELTSQPQSPYSWSRSGSHSCGHSACHL